MSDRIEQQRPTIKTFHSSCQQMMRKRVPANGIKKPSPFYQISTEEIAYQDHPALHEAGAAIFICTHATPSRPF